MSLARDELLVLLIEECGEIIQAATKCLRFGWDRNQPDYGVNHEVLANEIGDALGVIDALPLNGRAISQTRVGKIRKAEAAKESYGIALHPSSEKAYQEVMVPRELLILCHDLFVEIDKHMPITGTNFDDDFMLAKSQLARLTQGGGG